MNRGLAEMSWLAFHPRPHDQLLFGVFALVCGLLVFPFATAKMIQFFAWINTASGAPAAWETFGTGIARRFFAVCCAAFTLVGALQLVAYAIHEAGLIRIW